MQDIRHHRTSQSQRSVHLGIILLGIASIIFILMFAIRVFGFFQKIYAGQSGNSPSSASQKTAYSFLLLGYGGGKHEGTYLTDTIMVLHLDTLSKKALLISIPRDLWVQLPTIDGPSSSKINAIYQMGLFPKNYPEVDTSRITKENPAGIIKMVIEHVTGLKIDGFVAIDFKGFIKAIDTLGGVDINVQRSFTDYEYPLEGEEENLCGRDEDFKKVEPILNNKATQEEISKIYSENPQLEQFVIDIKDYPVKAFPCRYEELQFKAGQTHMDGVTALKYSRSRHASDDGGDFNRATRQQNVLEAVRRTVLSIGFIPKIIPLMNDLEDHVITDISLEDTNKLLLEATSAEKYSVTSLVLADNFLTDSFSDYGGYIIIPKAGIDNWSEIKTEIKHIIQGITPTPNLSPSSPVK